MSASPAKIAIGQSYGESDTGRKRRRNEDTFVCEPPLFAVADGMGGAQAGEVASSLAANALKERPRPRAAAARTQVDRADPGGEPPRPPARARRRGRLGHGHDDDGRALRRGRRLGHDRPRRRLARLPAARRAARAADRRPLARRRARAARRALAGGGRGAPAALRDHARARHRPRRRRRRVHGPGAAGRRLPALLRRPDDDGRRRRDRRARAAQPRRPRGRRRAR